MNIIRTRNTTLVDEPRFKLPKQKETQQEPLLTADEEWKVAERVTALKKFLKQQAEARGGGATAKDLPAEQS